jgi:hypothetical protein
MYTGGLGNNTGAHMNNSNDTALSRFRQNQQVIYDCALDQTLPAPQTPNMKMYVYGRRGTPQWGQRTPLVVETNLQFALPYWTDRKLQDSSIYWEIK